MIEQQKRNPHAVCNIDNPKCCPSLYFTPIVVNLLNTNPVKKKKKNQTARAHF